MQMYISAAVCGSGRGAIILLRNIEVNIIALFSNDIT